MTTASKGASQVRTFTADYFLLSFYRVHGLTEGESHSYVVKSGMKKIEKLGDERKTRRWFHGLESVDDDETTTYVGPVEFHCFLRISSAAHTYKSKSLSSSRLRICDEFDKLN
jgi:hypothetical protein